MNAVVPLTSLGGDHSNLMLSLMLSSVLQMTNFGTESLCQECDTSSRHGFRFLYFSTSLSANSSADISTESQDSTSASRDVGRNSKEWC